MSAPSSSAPPATGRPAAPAAPAPAPSDVNDAGTTVHATLRARRWTSQGSVRVTGAANVESAELRGIVSIGDGLTAANDLRTEGTLDVSGAFRVAGSWSARGTSRIHASIAAGRIEGEGMLEVEGSLEATNGLAWHGRLVVREGVRSGRFVLVGTIDTPGTVDAAELDWTLRAASRAEAIRAKSIRIRSPRRLLGGKEARLTVQRIDATEAYLEGVRAEHVHVDRLSIGPDCHLSEVTGGIVARHRSAHVGPEAEVPRPYGLTP